MHATLPTLLALMDLSSTQVAQGIIILLCTIMCITVHEFGHAYVADRLGDPLPRAQGRVTLNPLKHLDPMGTLFIALMSITGMRGLGWGKPVEWSGNPRYLTRRFSMRTIRFMVSVAGPAMNLLLALLLSPLFVLMNRTGIGDGLAFIVMLLIQINLGLMFFNLLPIPPLDGRSFLEFLPDSLGFVRDVLFRYGSFIFIALILIGPIGNGPSPLQIILWPFLKVQSWYVQFLASL